MTCVLLQTGTGSGTMTECGVSCQCRVTPSCWTRWSARRRASSSGPRSRPDPSPRSSSTRTSRTADVGPSDSRRSGWVLYPPSPPHLPLLYPVLSLQNSSSTIKCPREENWSSGLKARLLTNINTLLLLLQYWLVYIRWKTKYQTSSNPLKVT